MLALIGRRRAAVWIATAAIVAIGFLAPPPDGLSGPALRAASIGLVMALWWMTETAPLAATALLPLAAFPLTGVLPLDDTAASYANPLIFLFLGGFLLAKAMERWGLHRRVARAALSLAGARPRAILAAVMGATAFLSLWVSNTATAMAMTPIAAALAAALATDARSPRDAHAEPAPLGAALMLGIAFSATIGGMGSLIGTPPNALFAGYMASAHGVAIGFAEWMLIGVPVVLVLLPIAWTLLCRLFLRDAAEASESAARSAAALSRPQPWTREEAAAATIMVMAAAAWVTRPWLASWLSLPALSDAGIAIAAALLLFVFPARTSDGAPHGLISWADAAKIRWDVLILFGGGLALADAIGETGLAGWLGAQVSAVGGSTALATLVMMVVVVYLGELASNTAMAAVFLPVAGAAAVGLGYAPITLTLPIALAASLGFMLPVATPPNAIVYGAGLVSAGQMLRAGAALDVISILIVYALAMLLAPLIGFG